ncbi:MAG TPA: exopolysaccharide biosynthesis protein [Phototrophicaceae bacterium]|nr:exopolysaccharide biosynthesis protein [Phototrophicaceae bacterium]
MSVQMQDTDQTLAEALTQAAHAIQGDQVTLREILKIIGEQGLIFVCMFLCIPFLIPVSIPGVSTVFGAAIILMSISITLNRLPWLPERIMNRPIATEKLIPTLEKGAEKVARIDRWVRPRMNALTTSAAMNRFNGLMLMFGGILLIFPFGLIPFSNTLPALAVIFLGVGMLQRDGLFILLGYLMNLATVIYFGFLFLAAIAAGNGILSLMGSG